MREGSVDANGLRFSYIEQGEGPLVLLLHGFPDNAFTWDRVMPALADSGYRAVAPFTRGYPPTSAPADGRYDPAARADDVAALIDEMNGGEPAFVVGHDWGASATYATIVLHPNKVRRAVAIAIGPPGGTMRIFERPDLLHHAFHFWLFQVPVFSEMAVRANDFAMIDYLWHLWSPGIDDAEHIKRVKETLAGPNAVEQALGYYRAMMQFPMTHPGVAQRILSEPLGVPTLLVMGGNESAFDVTEGSEKYFGAEHRREIVEGAGHFVQREQPEALTRLILEWVGAAS
jgi:pimeloyl-ACP methyl ester carboxylesterase